jgi:hypothetical protein
MAMCARFSREWASINADFERWGRLLALPCHQLPQGLQGLQDARHGLAGPTAHSSNMGMTGTS